jgi:hypothetical protein
MGQHHSPYLAMSNNPISSIDRDGGMDEDDVFARSDHSPGMNNGDADATINRAESIALTFSSYNHYRAEHTNGKGEWGEYVTGQDPRDLGDESHTHFHIDPTKFMARPEQSSNWQPLTKQFLKDYTQTNICPTCNDGQLERETGLYFEDLFETYVDENFFVDNLRIIKNPVDNKYDGGIRNTVPDFLGIGFEPGEPPLLIKNVKITTFYELKATTKKSIGESSFENQIKAQIFALSKLKSNGSLQSMVLVTTSGVKIGNSIKKYVQKHSVALVHNTAMYKIDPILGNMFINLNLETEMKIQRN